ncbi:MAG: beta-propeller fold lactonase family protein [Chitinophagales bacterium]
MKQLKLTGLALGATLIALFNSCSKNEGILPAGTPSSVSTGLKLEQDGYVYTMGNQADLNMIYSYEQHADGSLTLDSIFASGGSGSGEGLGTQGSLVLNEDHTLLFAVNAGDNSISSFTVDAEGILALSSTHGSEGTTPVSLTVYGKYVYVVNSGSDNIAGFTIDINGSLNYIPGSSQPLSTTEAGPGQISFRPNGNQLLVTEKATSRLTFYNVTGGVASAPQWVASAGKTPFGFDFMNNKNVIITNAEEGIEHLSSATSYYYLGGNNISSVQVSGPVENNQTAACWLVIAKGSTPYAYVSNTGSNNISSYAIDMSGNLTLVHDIAATTHEEPLDMSLISTNGNYLYCVTAGNHGIDEFSRNTDGTLEMIGSVEGLPASVSGLAAYR